MLCGAGRRVINPDKGHCISGFGLDYANTGVHDDLTVTAVFLQSGEQQGLLLNFDIEGLERELNARLRQAVSEATGLPAQRVFPTCTHTHSGPETRTLYHPYGPVAMARPEYDARLVQWAAEAAAQAKVNAEECVLSYNFDFAHENMNRRYNFPDRRSLYIPDHMQLRGQSSEFVDRELGVLGFRKKGTNNEYKVIITNYAAHPLCIGNSSNLISADYQGYLRRAIEETFAGCMCMATTGAAGDMHPLMPRGGFEKARQMGTNLAMLATCRLYDAVTVDFDDELRLAWLPLKLKLKDVEDASALPTQPGRDLLPYLHRQGQTHYETAAYLLGIGPVLLGGAPGELVAELGAMFKWSSPFVKSFILYNAADEMGYIPTRNQYRWGCYEANSAAIAPGEGERIISTMAQGAVQLLDHKPLKLPAVAY